jgi:2-C-methyl-D-erythritol 2,4-cyclodiphosphate synthase
VSSRAAEIRLGIGIDTHPWGQGRSLYLGGARFEGETGLAGHSDGDVICHALADALLGAAAMGDIGEHFPDTDPSIEGIAGLDLLARVVALLIGAGFVPQACDVTLVAERPHIAGRRDEIRKNLAAGMGIRIDRVSVKATRPEGLGLSGEGAGCLAVATVAAPPSG